MKRWWSLLLVLLLIPCLVVAVSAEEATGTCGDNLTWVFEDTTGTLTISGTGDMWDFETEEDGEEGAFADTPWGPFSLKKLIVEEGVTGISELAFRDDALTNLTLPDTLTRIGAFAFINCDSLKSVVIPGSVTEIGKYAFANCDLLESAVMEEGVARVSEGMFSSCIALKQVTVPDSVEQIGRRAFFECESLTNVTLGKGLHGIDAEAFFACPGLLKITIPEGVTVIGEEAFEYCGGLTAVTVPGSVRDIGRAAFANCPNLSTVRICEGVTVIGESVFTICRGLRNVAIPASVTKIGRTAFADCESLENVYYALSETEREKIEIGEKNGRLLNADWHYNKAISLNAPEVTALNSAGSGKPRLSWEAVEEASEYRIYRATSKTGAFKYLATTTAISYTDKDIRVGNNHYYKVKARGESGESFFSTVVNRCCDLKCPVVTLKVDTASGKPKVTFEKISGAEKYYIVRSTSEKGTYSKLATITGTTYIDKTAKAGKTYYYKVKALHAKDAADSAYSKVTSRVCDLKKPVVTIFLKDGDPRIKWDAITGAEKYQIYRATSKDGEYTLVKTTKTSTSYTDTDVKAGKTYYYKVRAIHEIEAANSAFSTVKYIKAQ